MTTLKLSAADVDEEVYETQGINDDYDQKNQDQLTNNKHTGSTFTQQSQWVDQDEINPKNSQKIFGQESNQNI